jgi:hypothetical protein
MRRKRLFNPPHLNDAGGDLTKPWYVEVGYRDPQSDKMVRKRYQEEFTTLRTKKEHYALAEKIGLETAQRTSSVHYTDQC